MYYSYVEIEYVATSFSPARTDLAVKLLTRETKTWHAKIYLPTQCTNWRILTSAKRYDFDPLLTSLMQQAS